MTSCTVSLPVSHIDGSTIVGSTMRFANDVRFPLDLKRLVPFVFLTETSRRVGAKHIHTLSEIVFATTAAVFLQPMNFFSHLHLDILIRNLIVGSLARCNSWAVYASVRTELYFSDSLSVGYVFNTVLEHAYHS